MPKPMTDGHPMQPTPGRTVEPDSGPLRESPALRDAMRTPDEIADELLVLDSQAGNEQAWHRLVKRWHPKLFGQARRVAGSPEAAADITQEAWLAILRSIRRLDDPAKFRSWAHRIVANKTADWIRRKQRTRQLIQRVAQEKQPSESDNSHAINSARNEQVEMVRKTIRKLPVDHQRLLRLFYVEGKSIKEISQRLSIPTGTVKSRLHSIRKEMRTDLEQNDLHQQVDSHVEQEVARPDKA